MRLSRLPAQARALAEVSRAAAAAYGTSPLTVARRARRLRTRQGYEYREALSEGLLDPALSAAELARHGSRRATLVEQRRLNSEAIAPLAGEKAVFYRHCAALGIRTPRLLGVIDTSASGWSHTGRPVVGADGFARFVEEDLPDAWVLKPSAGFHGHGVRILERRDGRLTDASGRPTTPVALFGELAAEREFPAWVVQERLVNHPDIAGLIDAPTLQTARLVTLVGRDGVPELLYAVFRIAVAGGATDNFVAGASGNGLADVSISDGVLQSVKFARENGLGFARAPELPGSGIRVAGVQLPHWDEAVELVLRAARAFLPARSLGWDVALTPDGPVIVETNMFWWPRSGPEQGPLLERLRDA